METVAHLDHSLLERTSHDRVAELFGAYVARRAAELSTAPATPAQPPDAVRLTRGVARDPSRLSILVLASDLRRAMAGPGTGRALGQPRTAGKGIDDDDDSGKAPVPKRGLGNALGKRQLTSTPTRGPGSGTWPSSC